MGTKHKHAEVIKAWADGEEIEYFNGCFGWRDAIKPTWGEDIQYRVRPKNIVVTRRVLFNPMCELLETYVSCNPNIQYEFTLEGTLVSVRLLK